jgi:hypothetical protein
MARIDQTLTGQDFAIGIRAATAALAHSLTRANATSLEPRIVRMLGRLSILPDDNARGLLKSLSVSGWPLLLNPGPGTVVNVQAGSSVSGFPGRALDPLAMVDRHNTILCAAGPNSPVELGFDWSASRPLDGMIGTDLPDISLLPEILDSLAEGDLWGEPNYGLGGGEMIQVDANAAQTMSMTFKSPRRMYLERLVVDGFKNPASPVGIGDIRLTAFTIAGTPLFSTSAGVDVLVLSPYATDEDGLMVNDWVDTDDEISLSFACAALGAGVRGGVQVGWFTS